MVVLMDAPCSAESADRPANDMRAE